MLVLELSGSLKGTLASVKIAQEIARQTEEKLVGPSDLRDNLKGLLGDSLVVIPNLPKLCINNPESWEPVIETAKVVVWVQNDYAIWAPPVVSEAESMFSRAFTARIRNKRATFVWTSCPDRFPEWYREYANWNCLAYSSARIVKRNRIKDKVLYYGACRDGRMEDFMKYFSTGDLFTVSTAAKKKFEELLPSLTTTPPLPNTHEIGKYAVGLYIEDKRSHKEYHSPATRLYEMLSNGLAILVDKKAVATLERGGFNCDPLFVVDSVSDVRAALQNQEKIAEAQQSWRKVAHKQRAQLIEQIKSLPTFYKGR